MAVFRAGGLAGGAAGLDADGADELIVTGQPGGGSQGAVFLLAYGVRARAYLPLLGR